MRGNFSPLLFQKKLKELAHGLRQEMAEPTRHGWRGRNLGASGGMRCRTRKRQRRRATCARSRGASGVFTQRLLNGSLRRFSRRPSRLIHGACVLKLPSLIAAALALLASFCSQAFIDRHSAQRLDGSPSAAGCPARLDGLLQHVWLAEQIQAERMQLALLRAEREALKSGCNAGSGETFRAGASERPIGVVPISSAACRCVCGGRPTASAVCRQPRARAEWPAAELLKMRTGICQEFIDEKLVLAGAALCCACFAQARVDLEYHAAAPKE